jgi:hypothetical protein
MLDLNIGAILHTLLQSSIDIELERTKILSLDNCVDAILKKMTK